jgi:hypothetical protein
MTMLRATTTVKDQRRWNRLLIAWADGDKLALDTVLTEVMRDPTGTPALVFSLTDYAARLSAQVAPDFREQLRAALYEAVNGHERDEEHPG